MTVVVDPDGERVIHVDPARNSRLFGSSAPDGGVSMIGGQTVSYADIAVSQMWVAAAIDWFIWKTVLVPLKVYERTGPDGERRRLGPDEEELAAAIRSPWPRGSSVSLVQHLIGPLLVHGNSLTPVEEGARNRIRFRPVDWRRSRPVRDPEDDQEILGWTESQPHGRKQSLGLDSTMHVAWWSPLGPLGESPLRKLGTTLAIEDAAQRWATGQLGRSYRPDGVVQLDEKFLSLDQPDQQALYDATAERMRVAYGQGADTAGKIAIFPPGVNWKDAKPQTAVEAQLTEQRRIDREEIAAVYQVAPPMLGILDKTSYNNITTLRQVSYTDGLAPPLVMIEATINATVCRGLLRRPELFVEFDFAGVLRGDRLKEIQAIREAISTAVLTPNEGRDIQNRPRSKRKQADQLWLPQNNLKPLGDGDPDSDA